MNLTLSRPLRPAVLLVLAMLASFSAASVLAAPFWGDQTPQPAETPPQNLQPGQFKWQGGAIPSGPIVVVVSLTEQRAYVYRNGVRTSACWSIATGSRSAGQSSPQVLAKRTTGVALSILNADRPPS